MDIKHNFRIESLRRFKLISDPQISPNGEKIAFVLSSINYEKDVYERHIWMLDVKSGEVTQFTHGSIRDTYPRWSHDGKQLLYKSSSHFSDKKKSGQLWVISKNGNDEHQVTDLDFNVNRPLWSPDSKKILFLSRDWTETKPTSDVIVVKRLKYKHNGVGIFAGKRTHLYTVKVGEKPKQLTSGDYDVIAAKWSPDGCSIAFVANMDTTADLTSVRDIYLVPATGGDTKKLTYGKYVINDISFSPDGLEMAFIGNNRPSVPYANMDLCIMPLKGGEMRNLSRELDRSIGRQIGSDLRATTPNPGAVWSPDGKYIYVVTASVPYSNIYNVEIRRGEIEALGADKTVDGFSISKNGKVMAYTSMDETRPADLWIKDNKGEKRVTGFNDDLLGELSISKPEHFFFTNPVGDKVDSYIIRPPDHKKDVKYPAILVISSPPLGAGIFHEYQVLAANGFVVFYTNLRGRTGYGEKFQAWKFGDYPGPPSEDLRAFVDEVLVRFPIIDPQRLGVTGGSQGGYLTNWLISHTDQFKAAVTCRSICNRVSCYGTADGDYRKPMHVAGDPNYWDHMEKHIEKSPLRYAKYVKTPTLIIHSEQDLRTPMEQAEQWFVALKLNGVPTELVRFPNENHDLSRSGKPKHREERLSHILRWFNKYLKYD